MGIFRKSDDAAVLAEHGRWVVRLRDDVKMLDQRLRSIERRVRTVEDNLANLAKDYGKLDIALSRVEAEGHGTRGRRG